MGISQRAKRETILVAIFLVLLAMRIPGLANPPADYHNWRQSDTEAIARNLIENNFAGIYPQLNYDGPAPNFAQLELPVTSLAIALLYKIFGYNYLLARLVPVAFFLAGAYFLYLIGLKFFAPGCAAFSLLLYGIFPFNIYFSRAIMPEAGALFFQLGGFYFFLVWLERGKKAHLGVSALLISLAVTQKVPAILILVPLSYILFVRSGWRLLGRSDFWLLFLTAVIPAFLYFFWLARLAQADYVTGIATRFWPALQENLLRQGAGGYLISILARAFTGTGLLFVFFVPVLFQERFFPLLIWLITMVLEAGAVVSAVRLDYYVLFLGPPLALLGGRILGGLSVFRRGFAAALLILSLIFFEGYQELAPRYAVDSSGLLHARAIAAQTKKEDLLILGLDNPALLNLSQRKGWRANINYHQDPAGEIKQYLHQGAKYFIMIGDRIYGDEDGSYQSYLDRNFEHFSPQEGITFYKLD